MGILSVLNKGLQAMIDEVNTPASFKMGEKFEDYVREFLFIDKYYDLVERTHSYQTNKSDYVESSLKPDFKFRDKRTKKEFYVEAKFRTGEYKGKVQWCNDSQLKRYLEYNKNTATFLILGMGQDPEYPEFLCLLPMIKAKYTGLFPSYLDQFEITIDKEITSKLLWDR